MGFNLTQFVYSIVSIKNLFDIFLSYNTAKRSQNILLHDFKFIVMISTTTMTDDFNSSKRVKWKLPFGKIIKGKSKFREIYEKPKILKYSWLMVATPPPYETRASQSKSLKSPTKYVF